MKDRDTFIYCHGKEYRFLGVIILCEVFLSKVNTNMECIYRVPCQYIKIMAMYRSVTITYQAKRVFRVTSDVIKITQPFHVTPGKDTLGVVDSIVLMAPYIAD